MLQEFLQGYTTLSNDSLYGDDLGTSLFPGYSTPMNIVLIKLKKHALHKIIQKCGYAPSI